jgi:integrase/recombinase XerD
VNPVEIFAGYQNRLERRKVKPASIREYRIVTTTFIGWMATEGKTMEEIRRTDIEDFMADTGWSPSTQWARLTWLRAPWKYAKYELEVLDRTPFEGMEVELAPIPSREPKVISNADLREIKAGIKSDRHWVLFHLLAYTGMRLMEVRGLLWEGVSRKNQTLHIIGKGDKERTIPLHPALQEALGSLTMFKSGSAYVLPGQAGGMLTHGGGWKVVKTMAAGFEVSAHDFRRSFASSMHDNEAKEAATRQILGHPAHGDAHAAYHRISQRYLYREILKVYADDPI